MENSIRHPHQDQLEELIFLDKDRLEILKVVFNLGLPDCWVAAGFVRNLVWDHLHQRPPSELNDVDVIFFDPAKDISEDDVLNLLNTAAPQVEWEVKNQARMHLKHDDAPYKNTAEAMAHWPEKETAVGVRLMADGRLECLAPFGLESLFKGFISHNPRRPLEIFNQRIASKGWLTTWPGLKVKSVSR